MDTPGSGPKQTRYDVVVVGGGHNGLVVCGLPRPGRPVRPRARAPRHDRWARWSRRSSSPACRRGSRGYAYLVSLFPDQIVKDLGLDVQFRSRRTTSYTPAIRRRAAHRAARGAQPDPADRRLVPRADRLGRASTTAGSRSTAASSEFAQVRRAVDARAAREREDDARADRRRTPGDARRAAARPSDRGDVRRRPRARHRRHRRPDRHLRRPARPRPATRTAASSTTSSATAPASGGCRSAAWARSRPRSSAPVWRNGGEVLTRAFVTARADRRHRRAGALPARRRVPLRGVRLGAGQRRAVGDAAPARRAARARGPRARRSRSTCCSTGCRGCGRASHRRWPSPAPSHVARELRTAPAGVPRGPGGRSSPRSRRASSTATASPTRRCWGRWRWTASTPSPSSACTPRRGSTPATSRPSATRPCCASSTSSTSTSRSRSRT